MKIEREKHGLFYNQNVDIFTLSNNTGMKVKISQLGGIITHLWVPDEKGNIADVVAGYDEIKSYAEPQHFMGALIGRVANRIEGAQYTLAGKTHKLNANVYDGKHNLHGGYLGYNLRVWRLIEIKQEKEFVALHLKLFDQDGEQGFAGNVVVDAVYTLTDKNLLKLEMTATTDMATPVSFTEHSYFNLNGHDSGSIENHVLQLNSTFLLEQKEDRMPTGKVLDVANTCMDFSAPTLLTTSVQEMHDEGINHSYVMDNHDKELILMATLSAAGRQLKISSNEQTLHFYNGHNLNDVKGKNGAVYSRFSALCLEPKNYVNGINIDAFPSNILHPGEIYNHSILYDFG
ncbi:aldose epimerase family protein [Vibrio algarum]|uniref:Aldose 1-epimerase n=1 Tax=Vibrio algarum TaxID=3020714 RepID=A0ABT4YXN1_9VIBR|nr:aldose epimerase family protein [Vibrio sp. KJ40-1]MDB1126334.1 galactose mutarotase [Vibrio sp. KJ40-1]